LGEQDENARSQNRVSGRGAALEEPEAGFIGVTKGRRKKGGREEGAGALMP